MRRWFLVQLIAISLAACGGDEPYSVERLQDPTTCLECHPRHYQQWSGSMHAYASDDPVFVAMNNRGQRETGGRLGDFCVRCHAPMAVALGYTDGTNFDPTQLPPQARGITCYACHNVSEVTSTHNNGLVIANDQTMRGGVKDPVDSPAHRSAYDVLMDSDVNESEVCGSCHDVVVPASLNGRRDIALERTHAEWQTTIFAKEKGPAIHLTCGGCHMQSSTGLIADASGLGVTVRTNGIHEHMWPAIDQALTPFPELEAQAAAIQRDLDPSIGIKGPTPLAGGAAPGGICVTPENGGQITVRVDSFGTGHSWPSGAAQDRRSWLELIAYGANNEVIFQTGVVPDGVDPEAIGDPNLFGFWDRTFKQDGSPAHFFWDVDRIDSQLLRPPVTLDKLDPAFDHSVTKVFSIFGRTNEVERITARFLFRALPYALLDDLIASGDLDPSIRARVPTLTIGATVRMWERASRNPATGCSPR